MVGKGLTVTVTDVEGPVQPAMVVVIKYVVVTVGVAIIGTPIVELSEIGLGSTQLYVRGMPALGMLTPSTAQVLFVVPR